MKSYPLSVTPIAQSPVRISPKEGQVLDLATLRTRDIAIELNISEHTVKSHLKSAFAKLGVETRAQAAVLWMRRAA